MHDIARFMAGARQCDGQIEVDVGTSNPFQKRLVMECEICVLIHIRGPSRVKGESQAGNISGFGQSLLGLNDGAPWSQ